MNFAGSEKTFSNLGPRKKINLISLIAFLGISLVGLTAFVYSTRQKQETRKGAAGGQKAAFFKIGSDPATVGVGNSKTVKIYLNPAGETVDGVDVILKFNPDIVRLTGIRPKTGSGFSTYLPITDTMAFDQSKVVSDAQTNRQLEFGAVAFNSGAGPTSPVTGYNDILLAEVDFLALKAGVSLLQFMLVPEGTTDCNIVTHSAGDVEDVLDITKVVHGEIRVETVQPTNTPTLAPQCTPGDTLCCSDTQIRACNSLRQWGSCQNCGPGQICLDDRCQTPSSTLTPTPTPIPGDVDGNREVDGLDVIYLISYFGNLGACPACDLDHNGRVDGLDVIMLIGYL